MEIRVRLMIIQNQVITDKPISIQDILIEFFILFEISVFKECLESPIFFFRLTIHIFIKILQVSI